MRVNVLPVYTFQRLGMNFDEVDVTVADSGSLRQAQGPQNGSQGAQAAGDMLPAGVTLAPAQDEAAVRAVFASAREKIAASEQGAVAPNGDTSSVYKDSAIPTGMGGEMEKFLDGAGCKTDIYTVEAGVKAGDFLMINHHMEDKESAVSRELLHLKEGAELTLIMDYHTPHEAAGFLGVQTRVLLEKGAKLTIVKANMLGEGFLHLDDLGAALMDHATLELVRIDLGGTHVANGAHVNLIGKEAKFHAESGYLCRRTQKYDMNYVATARGEGTDAGMFFRGVLQDKGEKTFRGTLDFKRGAKGAVGEEQEDTLILSADAINRAIPVILCQEEDVEGHHGATIGELSQDVLFYFASRGIDAEEAKRIMVRARLLTIARRIPEPHLRGHVEDFLRKQL